MKKLIALIGTLVLCISLIVSATFAWETDVDTVDNTLKIADFVVKMDEVFDSSITTIVPGSTRQKAVTLTNTSDQPGLLRVMAYPTIYKTDSDLVLDVKDLVTFNLVDDTLWKDGNDGYYYYLGVIKPGESVEFLASVKLSSISDMNYSSAAFDVILRSEACIINGQNAHHLAWWNLPIDPIASTSPYYAIEQALQAAIVAGGVLP